MEFNQRIRSANSIGEFDQHGQTFTCPAIPWVVAGTGLNSMIPMPELNCSQHTEHIILRQNKSDFAIVSRPPPGHHRNERHSGPFSRGSGRTAHLLTGSGATTFELDDVEYTETGTVPEPTLLAVPLAGMLALRLRRRSTSLPA